jgi:peptidoglycan hydrolase-like protein with peptidoglycan-binding domain
VRVVAGWVVVAAVLGTAGFVAGRATLAPPEATADVQPDAVHTVREAVVGRSSTFRVAVTWPRRTVAVAPGPGTVTAVAVESGAVVDAGAVLFRLDERPVVLAAGEVPAFRGLARGDTGLDVTQLQDLLRGEGFLTGAADGSFGAGTERAVRAWQRSLGLDPTGVVLAGDLVFAPDVPARVVLGEDVVVGRRVDGSTATVDVVLDDPRLAITVDDTSTVPREGSPVEVRYLDHVWSAVVGPVLPAEDERAATSLSLVGPDGGPVCGGDCAVLPPQPSAGSLTAEVEVVPRASGPAVPVAALGQDADGGYVVSTPDGARIPVTVRVTDGSRAVVDGVAVGQEILTVPRESGTP